MICKLDWLGFISIIFASLVVAFSVSPFFILIKPDTIGALVATAALIVTALTAFLSLKNQNDVMRLNNKAAIKQKWVNDFRSEIVFFTSRSALQNDLRKEHSQIVERIHKIKNLDDEADINKYEGLLRELNTSAKNIRDLDLELLEKINCLRLFLDVEIPSHAEVIQNIEAWIDKSDKWLKETNLQKAQDLFEEGMEVGKNIIKSGQKVIQYELREFLE